MTFIRAVITAWMTSQLIEHADWMPKLAVLVVAAILWRASSDPLPAAIDRGLEIFRKRYQR
jgi:hypothetical protein